MKGHPIGHGQVARKRQELSILGEYGRFHLVAATAKRARNWILEGNWADSESGKLGKSAVGNKVGCASGSKGMGERKLVCRLCVGPCLYCRWRTNGVRAKEGEEEGCARKLEIIDII